MAKNKAKKKPKEIESEPDWQTRCEVCGAVPTLPETGMCGPCTLAISVPCSCSRLEFPHVHSSRCREWVYSFAPFALKPKGKKFNAPKDNPVSVRQEIPQPKGKASAPGRGKKKVG